MEDIPVGAADYDERPRLRAGVLRAEMLDNV